MRIGPMSSAAPKGIVSAQKPEASTMPGKIHNGFGSMNEHGPNEEERPGIIFLASREVQFITVCISCSHIQKIQLADIVGAQHPTGSCHQHMLFSPGP